MSGVQGLWWKIVIILTLAVIGPRVIKFLRFAGYHKTVYNHAPGPCQHVKGIDHGAEDMQMVSGSLALMTTGLRFMDGYFSSDPFWTNRKGNFRIFDFARPDEGAKTVEIQGNFNTDTLNPHGMSIWNDKQSGRIFVFVVNHLPELKEAIERFEFLPVDRVLKHLETISGKEHMYLANDLVAVGPDSFYFTNSVYNSGEWLMKLELYSMMRWGHVVYYDGGIKKTKIVADDLYLPNGITTSPDGTVVYVALYGDRSITAYKINKDHSLTHLQELEIYTSPDNLINQGQYLLATTHPVFYKFVEHAQSHLTKPSPSQVLKINIDMNGRLGNITQVFADDGTTFSSSSVTVHYKGRQLLIGSVYGKALYCEVTTVGLL